MVDLRSLEFQYPTDFRAVFEDIATLIFCMECTLSRGVNRRKNQKGIESDPVEVFVHGERKIYAYQAKYYDASTYLSKHKDDLLKCIHDASKEMVTDLLLFVNKDLPNKKASGEEYGYIQKLNETANNCGITLDWWTNSKIETTLNMPGYENIRDIYFSSADAGTRGIQAFYRDTNKSFSHIEADWSFPTPEPGSYIDPKILADGKEEDLKEYLTSWVQGTEKIMFICGEPGQGKTTLCRKFAVDFYKSGWLSGLVSNVFFFSLNPYQTDAITEKTINIDKLLSWGYRRKKTISCENCKNALVFLDDFDQLFFAIQSQDKLGKETQDGKRERISRLLASFEEEISYFQQESDAHIILLGRTPLQSSFLNTEHFSFLESVSMHQLLPVSSERQIEWIQNHIYYSRKIHNDEIAAKLETYLVNYQRLAREMKEEDEGQQNVISKELLGIPLFFRLAVAEGVLPKSELSLICAVYEKLVNCLDPQNTHAPVFGRGVFVLGEKGYLRAAFNQIAKGIFLESNQEGMEIDFSLESEWNFSFYTRYEGKNRICFLHKSLYYHFLASEIFSWYRGYREEKDFDRLKDNLKYLSWNRIDQTTLDYFREIYLKEIKDANVRSCLQNASLASIKTLDENDGFFFFSDKDEVFDKMRKRVSPSDRANNAIWNILSIGSVVASSLYVKSDWFWKHNLQKIILSNTCLRSATLDFAKLSKARMDGINLSGSSFINANLREADLSRSRTDDLVASFSGADLYKANLDWTDFKGAEFQRTNMADSTCRDATFCEAIFVGSNLRGAVFRGGHLEKADFTQANLEKADFAGASLKKADLTRANLTGADFTGASLEEADLSRADLTRANLKTVTLSHSQLIGDSLVNAVIVNTKLDGANLEGACLDGADCRGANLHMARNLSSITYEGIRVTRTDSELLEAKGLDLSKMKIEDNGDGDNQEWYDERETYYEEEEYLDGEEKDRFNEAEPWR